MSTDNDSVRADYEAKFPVPRGVAFTNYGIYEGKDNTSNALATFQQAMFEAWRASRERYVPRWIPVSERLPENEQRVLTYIGEPLACSPGKEIQQGVAYLADPDDEYACAPVTFAYYKSGFLGGNEVTHWMPLPDSPPTPNGGNGE